MKPKVKPCESELSVYEASWDTTLYRCEAGSVLLYLGSNMSQTVNVSSGCRTGQYHAETHLSSSAGLVLC